MSATYAIVYDKLFPFIKKNRNWQRPSAVHHVDELPMTW
jgi:hypothetical protein